jgi:hypothetical protein
VVIEYRQADLLLVVHATDSTPGFAGRLHRGKEHAHKGADDGDDDKQFDECEAAFAIEVISRESAARVAHHGSLPCGWRWRAMNYSHGEAGVAEIPAKSFSGPGMGGGFPH